MLRFELLILTEKNSSMKKYVKLLSIIIFCNLGVTTSYSQVDEELTNACRSGDLEAVKKLVASGVDVNAVRTDGAPALGEAMFWPEITQYMIEQGADPNGGRISALLIAANHYSLETMKVLLDNGADPTSGVYQHLYTQSHK